MPKERLEWFEENESDVNAFLVEALAELGAKETAAPRPTGMAVPRR
jgi:hypothetical protein